jgi:PEP-CTERM motif
MSSFRNFLGTLFAALTTLAGQPSVAMPVYTMTINEVIDGVEIIGGGGFELTSADLLSSITNSFSGLVSINPSSEAIRIGYGQGATFRINGLAGQPSFTAPGSFFTTTTVSAGPVSGFDLNNRVYVPWVGNSNSTRSAAINIAQARSFFDGSTLGSLGVIAGSYDYTYGVDGLSGGMGAIQVRINALATVPAPATLALVGLGLAGLGWSRRKQYS